MSWDINKKVGRPKKSVKPFGSDAQTGERTVFGSNSISDELEENLSVDFERGWGIVPQDAPPTRQDFNAGMFTNSLLTSYIFQQGVPEWDSNQTYFLNSVCQADGQIYISTDGTDGTPNIGNDPTTSDKWKVASGGGGEIADGSISEEKLDDDVKIKLNSGGEVADDSITTEKIADDSITTEKIADGNVTDEKLREVDLKYVENFLPIEHKRRTAGAKPPIAEDEIGAYRFQIRDSRAMRMIALRTVDDKNEVDLNHRLMTYKSDQKYRGYIQPFDYNEQGNGPSETPRGERVAVTLYPEKDWDDSPYFYFDSMIEDSTGLQYDYNVNDAVYVFNLADGELNVAADKLVEGFYLDDSYYDDTSYFGIQSDKIDLFNVSDDIAPLIKTKMPPNKFQNKKISQSISTTDDTDVVPDLCFYNLNAKEHYRITLRATYTLQPNSEITFKWSRFGDSDEYMFRKKNESTEAITETVTHSTPFLVEHPKLTAYLSIKGDATLIGNRDNKNLCTRATLEEINVIETDQYNKPD